VVEAGTYAPPVPPGAVQTAAPSPFADLPAFCRVAATLTPSADSDIKIDVWLPAAASWNGSFRGTHNFGLGGNGILAAFLAGGLRRGYATANNNTGHDGDSRYAIEHPEKVKDWGYRAAHEMTVVAKAIVKAYYGKAPAYS